MIPSVDAAATTATGNDSPVLRRPMRLAVVCDYLEEGWPSMDLFGDMLFRCYRQEHAANVIAEQLRPPFRFRLSRFPWRLGSRPRWNADRLINRFWEYPNWLRKQANRFDLFHLVDHSYSQLALAVPPGRCVVTCHDLDTFRCVLEPPLDPRPTWFRAMAQRSLNGFLRCSHVICVSAATRDELMRHNLFAGSQVTVIPPGVDPVFFSPQPAQFPPSIRASGRNFLLHVGSTIQRKRLDVLLRIFAEVLKAYPGARLVRVGGFMSEAQSKLAAALGVADKIIEAPRLTKAELAAVYAQAALVLQPSDAEGFGLPVIEALASGCPVVASDIPALREAGGSVAAYRPVADIEAWAEMVITLLRERETSSDQWEARKAAARRHAAAFTWEENARRTLSVYSHLDKPAYSERL